MGKVTFGSIMILVVFVVVIILICGVIPYLYNSNLEHGQTHGSYCDNLRAQIQGDKQSGQGTQIINNELQLYADKCSG